MKIHKGDDVLVLAGKFRGERAKVEEALPTRNLVILDGLNIAKRHTKPRSATAPGGIIDKDMPMPASSVAVVSPGDGQPTRVGYRIDEVGGVRHKVRICKRTGAEL